MVTIRTLVARNAPKTVCVTYTPEPVVVLTPPAGEAARALFTEEALTEVRRAVNALAYAED
jgi:hypothetical protein